MKPLKRLILMCFIFIAFGYYTSGIFLYYGTTYDYPILVVLGGFLLILILFFNIEVINLYRNRMPPDLAKVFHGEESK